MTTIPDSHRDLLGEVRVVVTIHPTKVITWGGLAES